MKIIIPSSSFTHEPSFIFLLFRNTNALKIDALEFLILDEADRLLDMGFERDIKAIIELIKEQRKQESHRTLLISATLSKGIKRLAGISLKNPKYIQVNIIYIYYFSLFISFIFSCLYFLIRKRIPWKIE